MPDHSVPVTTVPAPRTVNTRSTCRRSGPSEIRDATRAAARASAARSASNPTPLRTDTGTISAPGSNAAASAAARSGDARSVLVIATTPTFTPNAASTAACSRVWGITPSSAATTIRYRSMPVAPATIVRTNRSCPGTSTTETRPPGSDNGA